MLDWQINLRAHLVFVAGPRQPPPEMSSKDGGGKEWATSTCCRIHQATGSSFLHSVRQVGFFLEETHRL